MNILEQLKRSLAITKKDLSIYYLKGPVIIFGLLVPTFLFIAFSLKRELPPSSLIPGLWGMALFFTVSSITPVIAPWETRMRTFERLVSSPIALWAIILGDVVASFWFGLLITFFIFLASVVVLGTQIINFSLILGTILAAFCFSSLGALISAPPEDNPSNIMMLSTLIRFPLIFISGVFVPISEMGKLRILSYFSPLSYYTDLARHSIQGSGYFTPIIDLLALLGFGVLLFAVAIKWHQKSLAKRF